MEYKSISVVSKSVKKDESSYQENVILEEDESIKEFLSLLINNFIQNLPEESAEISRLLDAVQYFPINQVSYFNTDSFSEIYSCSLQVTKVTLDVINRNN